MVLCQKLNIHRIFKRLAKAPIRLRVCAGWSEPLLVAETTLLEISCHGSNEKSFKICPLKSSSSEAFRVKIYTIWNIIYITRRLDRKNDTVYMTLARILRIVHGRFSAP